MRDSFSERIAMLLAAGLLSAAGCSQMVQPVFQPVDSSLRWPPAPASPRIRYVGQIKTDADLKPAPKLFQPLADLLAGPKPPSPLYGPRSAIHCPASQSLWVADPGGRCVHRFDLFDRSYLKIEKAGGGPLLSPVGVCPGPDQSVYVCDSEGVSILRFDEESGAFIDSLRLPEDLRRPAAVAFHPPSNELYVVDSAAHDLKVLDAEGKLLRLLGRRGTRPGEFNFPCAIADDGELLWVVDTGNNRIQAITRTGEPKSAFGQAGDATGDLALPKGVAFDSDGNVYVVDARFENVQVFDRSGKLLLAFGGEGSGPGEFWLPGGIHIDPNDRLWICDSYNGRIQVFDYLKDPTSQPVEVTP